VIIFSYLSIRLFCSFRSFFDSFSIGCLFLLYSSNRNLLFLFLFLLSPLFAISFGRVSINNFQFYSFLRSFLLLAETAFLYKLSSRCLTRASIICHSIRADNFYLYKSKKKYICIKIFNPLIGFFKFSNRKFSSDRFLPNSNMRNVNRGIRLFRKYN
jgi:hypothetical protein